MSLLTRYFRANKDNNFRDHSSAIRQKGECVSGRTCAYQGVRNVRFLENLACFAFLLPPSWDLPFRLIAGALREARFESNFNYSGEWTCWNSANKKDTKYALITEILKFCQAAFEWRFMTVILDWKCFSVILCLSPIVLDHFREKSRNRSSGIKFVFCF